MNDGSILSVVFVVNYYAEFTYPFSKSTEHTARTTRAEGFPVMIILDDLQMNVCNSYLV